MSTSAESENSRASRNRPAWLHPTIVRAGLLTVAAGFALFGVTAVLGDVAEQFGHVVPGDDESLTAQVGMTATALGAGLAIVRLASLAGLPAAALADRIGRRRVLLITCSAGLASTALLSLSVAFWMFVAIAALARPLLSSANAISGVIAAEEVGSTDRAKAVALIAAAYAFGAGLIAVMRALLAEQLGFRGVFALSLAALALVPLLARGIEDPPIFEQELQHDGHRARLGVIPSGYRGRMTLVFALTAAASLVTGPAYTFLFVYGENVLGQSSTYMGLLVISAGPVGLLGLLVGRWGADTIGRRLTAGVATALIASAGIVMYSGSSNAMSIGYLSAIAATGMLGPSAGSLAAEVFPTPVRATAAGWASAASVLGGVLGLAVFGVVADAAGTFWSAAIAVATPVALASVLYAFLPETRGLELSESSKTGSLREA